MGTPPGKAASPPAVVLGSTGHDHILRNIFSHLDWKSVSKAANTVVRTTAELQLLLREAFYGLPSGYVDYMRGAFDPPARAAERLDRMIDVFQRWQSGSPRTIHRVGESKLQKYAVSQGLLVTCGVDCNHNTLRWNQEYAEIPSPSEVHDEGWSTSWSVFDMYNMRDLKTNPEQHLAKWTVEAGHEFTDFEVSREENVVITVQTMPGTKRQGGVDVDVCKIQVKSYLLEPTEEHQWTPGETVKAIPHPEGKAFSVLVPLGPLGADAPCRICMGPGGGVVFGVWGTRPREMWNWRTGKKIQSFESESARGDEQMRPLSGTGLLSLGLYESDPKVLRQHGCLPGSAMSLMFTDPTFKPPLKNSRILPGMTGGYDVAHCNLETDYASKLAIASFRPGDGSHRPAPLPEFSNIIRVDKSYLANPKWNSDAHPWLVQRDRDTRLWKNNAFHTTCGFRAITLENGVGRMTTRGTMGFNLHISDYRTTDPGVDTVHPGPLGSRPASTARPLPLTTTPKKVSYRRKCEEGVTIPWEWSNVWDESEEKGTLQAHSLIPEWETDAYGCLRRAFALGLEAADVDFIKADADHLYICSRANLTIISF